jgi:periplasmic protein TonB
MFETSVIQVQTRTADRRYGLFTLSVAAHAAIIAGLVAASIASVEMPNEAPPLMTIPVFGHVPPALGTPDAKPAGPKPAAPQPAPQRTPVPQVVTAPSIIPATVEPVASSGTATADTGADTGTGDTGTVGVPWGSPGGIGIDGPPATQAIEQAPAILHVGGDVKAPVVIRRAQPDYPRAAMFARLGGYVILECVIDRSGTVRDAKVLQSSSKLFEQSALDAVQQWQFKPGTLHGQPVDVIFNLTVRFEINR